MLPLNTASRIGLSVLLFLAGAIALRLGESFLVPLLISLLLATVLGPMAWWFHETLKIRWSLSCVVVIIGLIAANALVALVFSTSVMRLVNQFSNEAKVIEMYNNFRAKLENMSPVALDADLFPKNPQTTSQIGVLRHITDAAPYLLRETASITGKWSWQLTVILFITFFVMLEGRMLARRAAEIFGPSPEIQHQVSEVLKDIANQVRTYLVWRTIINLGLALVMGIVYSWANLSQAWAWAILLAILNYIPYFGPVLASIPPFLDAFILADPGTALLVFVLFWIVIVIEGYLIVPLLMGRNMDLNATTVMLACVFWELIWPGITGLFLAMPIMAAIKAILYHVPEWRPWANLMSSTDVENGGPPLAGLEDDPPADQNGGNGNKNLTGHAARSTVDTAIREE